MFSGTPGRLRLVGLVAMFGCVLGGVGAFVGTQSRSGALSNARDAAAQLVRIQTVQTNLVSADSNLTSGFLRGGLEPPAVRTAYSDGITAASTALAKAAGSDSRDAVALGKVNDAIGAYTGLVESARANNRQGFPIGTAYLRAATNLLRSDALPVLDQLVSAEQQRVDDAYDDSARAAVWVVAGLVIALVVLIGALVWLAVRTRRWLNLPIAGATVAVIVIGGATIGVMTLAQHRANDARDGAYLATVQLATARTDGFDARSEENLTLINRGSGQANEARFKQLADNATGILAKAAAAGGTGEEATKSAFATYLAGHTKIRTADDGGQWDKAVALADTTAATDFAGFDKASGDALANRADQLHDDLGKAKAPLVVTGLAALVISLLAAAACWWGANIRLREYQ